MSRPRLPWWLLLLGILGVGGSLTGLAWSSGRFHRSLQLEAAVQAARGAAGFLSLAAPTDNAGHYRPGPLVSLAHALAADPGWDAGLQVSWRGAPLLPDRIRLLPLGKGEVRRLAQGYAQVRLSRPDAGQVALVPLLDRDLWDAVGWVAVWHAAPTPPARAGFPWLLFLAALAGLSVVALAQPGGSRLLRGAAAVAALSCGLALAVRADGASARLAARATDLTLHRLRYLTVLAAHDRELPPTQLSRLAPGLRWRMLDTATTAPDSVRRELRDGQPVATVEVPLPTGGAAEIGAVPLEDRRDGFRAELLGWLVLLAATLLLVPTIARARGDRLAFRQTAAAWGFLAPGLAHLAVFAFGPVAFALYLSFHRWGLVEPVRPWVGLANYRTILTDPQFWHSLRVTGVYALYVPVTMALSLAAALALERGGVRVRLVRTILFLPFISSVVAVALVWQWMYQPDFGLINAGLHLLGLRGPNWLGDPRTALLAVMAMSIWVHLGYQMVIFLAGLQAIPREYHDAARVDGARSWQRFRYVTLPLLRPTILFVLVTGIIVSFQVFTYIAVMTEGGPLYATDVVVYRIYREAWEFLRFGTASAMSLVLLALLLLVTWVQFRWLGKHVELA